MGDRQGWRKKLAERGIDADLKSALNKQDPWRIGVGGFGEMPSHHDRVGPLLTA